MATTKTTIDNLAKEIEKSLKDFEGVTDKACAAGVMDTAQDAVKELRAARPIGSEGSPAGKYSSWADYNKGWGIFQTKTDQRYHIKATIHNKTKYRLTHLLEKGHAKVGGGRTQAFPHIAPVADDCENKLVENIRKRI